MALISVSSSSSPRIARWRCRGVILFTLRSLDALPANSNTSAVRYSRIAALKKGTLLLLGDSLWSPILKAYYMCTTYYTCTRTKISKVFRNIFRNFYCSKFVRSEFRSNEIFSFVRKSGQIEIFRFSFVRYSKISNFFEISKNFWENFETSK